MAENLDGKTRQPVLIGLTVTLMVLSATIVAARFASRRYSHVGSWWDDWFALISLIPVECVNAFVLAEVARGFGKHPSSPAVDVEFLKLAYLDGVVGYNPSLALIKISILLFYLRLFPTRAVRWSIFALLAIVVGWAIATELALIFHCTPIRKAWDAEVPGKCVDTYAFFIGQAVPNIVTDVLLLLLPLRPVWKLQMRISQRIVVSGIFCLGIVVVVCSIARLVSFINLVFYDLTWTWIVPGLWTMAEPNVGLLCACLPALGPFFRLAMSRLFPSTVAPSKQKYTNQSHRVNMKSWLTPGKRGDLNIEEDSLGRTLRIDSSEGYHGHDGGRAGHRFAASRGGSTPELEMERSAQGVERDKDSNIAMHEIHVMREVRVDQSTSRADETSRGLYP